MKNDGMRRQFPLTSIGRAAVALALALALPACTLFDDYLPGTPFTLDQPEAAVFMISLSADRIAETTGNCVEGGTVLSGSVRNFGSFLVEDVYIVIDVFGAAGVFLGSFRDHVYNGTLVVGEDDAPDRPGTSLDSGEAGYFLICTPVPFGSAESVEYRTEYVVVEEGGS